MIKAGEVAFLKTTGEAVYVLLTGEQVLVRRPVMGQNGVTHEVEQFHLGELETAAEQKMRFAAEREELLGKYAPGKIVEKAEFSA